MRQPKLFVWDFHGVLEKDNDLAVEVICNQVLEAFGTEDLRDILREVAA